jgi:putative transposase
MQQMAQNATLEHWGYLNPCRYVLDKKFCASFRDTLATANVKCLALPRRSPNLNAFAERNHQGKGNVLLFPGVEEFRQTSGPSIRSRERLGGLLKYYYPRVA